MLEKHMKILDLTKAGDTNALFMDEPDREVSLVIGIGVFKDMGSPEKVTMTLQPGDHLNAPDDFIGIDPMDADTNGLGEDPMSEAQLEEVQTDSNDIEDGFDMEQCSIRHPHGPHTWNRPIQPEKLLMCEGF